MPVHNHHEDTRVMLGVHLMTAQLHDEKVVPFDEHTHSPHIINLNRKLSLASLKPARRLSNNFKRSLSFMARHTQDVASPQIPTKQTIISPPRSSRSPSLSFVPTVKPKPKFQGLPKRSISTLSQITSPRSSPPPDFLLDDDPFANLTGFGGVCRQLSAKATGGYSPRSRLLNNDNNKEPLSTTKPPTKPQPQPQSQPQRPLNSPPTTSRPLHHPSLSSSSSLPLPHRPSPAHQRPAFKSRPSLPSLNTLANMNFAGFGVRKVRKGKVGAGLPFEPWNNLGSRPSSGETSSVEEEDETIVASGTGPATLPSLISVIESASTSDHELEDSKSSSPPFPPRSSSLSVPPSLSLASSSLPGTDIPPLSSELDADQFMDSFMEHYDHLDREEDHRDDAGRQDQEGPSQKEDNGVMMSLGEKVVVDEGGYETQMQLPPQPSPLLAAAAVIPLVDDASVSSSETLSSSMLAAATALALPLVDVASVSSSETFSTPPTLTAFPRTSSPVLASEDSSPFDPYSYTYPYPSSRQHSEMQMQLFPQLWSPTSLLAAPALPLVDTASVSSSDTLCASATLNAFSRSSSPILASPYDEKGRMRTAGLEIGGRRDLSTFLAMSSGSSASSSNEDDEDHYGPVNSSSSPSQSQAVVNVKLRSQHSRTTSSSISATSSGYITPPPKTLAVSRNDGSRFSESEDDDDDVDDDDNEEDNVDEDEDDDVPLAQRIPGALTAQKSIRRQVRQEREKKKQEKALRNHAETTRTRLMTLRPGGAVLSSSHDSASTALATSQTTTTTTTVERNSRSLTRNGSRSLNPFSREDSVRRRVIHGPGSVEAATTPVDATSLYQRLNSLNRSKSTTRSLRDVVRPPSTEALPPIPFPQTHPSSSQTQRAKSVKEPSSSMPYRFPTSPSPTPINSAYAPSSMTPLRPMRSFHFHRPSIDRRPIGMDDPSSVPLPSDAEKRISLNSTNINRSRPSTRDDPQQQQQQTSTFPTATPTHHRSLSRSRKNSFERPSPSTTEHVPVPPIPTTARISHDADKHSRASSRQHRPAPSVSSPADPLPMISNKPELVVQQRVFIGNMQRFNMVEIGASTTAGDIIEMIKAEGTFKEFAGSEGWMVFEVAQDFGMERPIRSFELVTDVQASWNKDKMVNYLVLRMTPLEVPLNRSAIPSSSPTHSGYVEWESKRGKWSKRFMQLREHSIWISKRESGQDQVHLCSLSNFDAYRVTRTHRAPKPFSFAVKSTDNLSFFENTADYLHSFACSEKEGKIWMEKILVARSYVLFQERHVLFNPKAVSGNTSAGVSRSGTRKATTTTNQRPHHDIFEPGSLLSKRL